MPGKPSNSHSLKSSVNQWCLVNGVPADYVSVDERGLQYGDGLFETIACEKKQLQFWSSHFLRLQQSAQTLGLVCPQENDLLDDIKRLLEKVSSDDRLDDDLLDNYIVKILITRGCSKRGYRVTDKNQLSRIVQLSTGDFNRFFSNNEKASNYERDKMATLGICQHRVSINPSLAGIKHLNRLENVLARNEWQDEYTEGLMLDANGYVIEGTMSNVFGIRDGQLMTPALENSGVAGVIRANIIELALNAGILVEINSFTLDEFYTMDEIFICNSLLEVLPVYKIISGKNMHTTAWQLETTFSHLPATTNINQMLQRRKTDNAKKF